MRTGPERSDTTGWVRFAADGDEVRRGQHGDQALGALVAIVGATLLGEAPSWARATAVALVALSAILHLTFVAAAPVWSILVIALDVIVLYALITTWDEPLRARR